MPEIIATKKDANLHLNMKFHLLVLGLLFSRIGTNIYTMALPWVAYNLSGSSMIMGTVFAVEMLPFVLLLPFGGVLIDRLDRRKLMITADIIRIIFVLSIPVMYWMDVLVTPMIFIVAFLASTLSFFIDVPLQAIIPQLVPKEILTKANVRIQLIENLSRTVGPLLGGALIGLVGVYTSLLINSIAYLMMVICLFFIDQIPLSNERQNAEKIWDDIKKGFLYVWKRWDLRIIACISILSNFGISLVMSTLVYYLRDSLHVKAAYTGVVFASIGIFGMLGSLVVEPLMNKIKRGYIISFLPVLGGGVGALLVAVFPHWISTAIGFGLWGGSITTLSVILNTYKQESIENNLYGRVEGSLTSISYVSIPLAGFIGGLSIQGLGSLPTYLVAGCSVMLAGLLAFFSPLRKI
ncbi:macrolide-efflux protein [Fictibacillus macauensis ZFHKF-1]|uniref:Macrolide-efflux protein n=1 Tax=Fictibacillus macauensis ZFHKF-1 TaxID=1196324 RepID=I8UIF0_9BACL|nr:MFS transporter [Fictibacillus macauensis]EIT86670.1 macrolide-efflux protein [Fictibacillus macauensis ZFHKF-1]